MFDLTPDEITKLDFGCPECQLPLSDHTSGVASGAKDCPRFRGYGAAEAYERAQAKEAMILVLFELSTFVDVGAADWEDDSPKEHRKLIDLAQAVYKRWDPEGLQSAQDAPRWQAVIEKMRGKR